MICRFLNWLSKMNDSCKYELLKLKDMKHILLLLLGLLLSLSSFALSKDSLHAVTMVSYEQGYSDYEGTLALKNNTDQTIRDVAFRITYLDMKGREMDYEDFSLKVNIAPGLTKKVDVEAYENNRNYSYYKSEAYPLGAHRFKIKFELLGYNKPKVSAKKSEVESGGVSQSIIDGGKDVLNIIFYPLVIALIFAVYVGVYVVVALMAKARNRSVLFWVIASFIGTPFIVMIILWFIGNADDGYENVE